MNKYIPDYYYQNIESIEYEKLLNRGITTLFFDLDNTVLPDNRGSFNDLNYQFFEKLAKDFKILIITNNNKKRCMTAFDNRINCFHKALKPFKIRYKKMLKVINSKPFEVCAIGDQILTDVLGANKMGFVSILVNPIDPTIQNWKSRFNRFIEKKILLRLKKLDPQLFEERLALFYDKREP